MCLSTRDWRWVGLYTVQDIEMYGRDVQQAISSGVAALVAAYKQASYKAAESGLKRLGRLSLRVGRFSTGKTFNLLLSRRLTDMDTGINEVETLLDGEVRNLSVVLQGCENNVLLLKKSSDALNTVIEDLDALAEEYLSDVDLHEAIIQRGIVLRNTLSMVNLELQKSDVVIQQIRTVSHQLIEAKENILPMVRIMWMNIVASRAMVSALHVRKGLRTALNGLITQNARQIEQSTKEIKSESSADLIDTKSLEIASQLLDKASRQITESKKLLKAGGMYIE